MIVILHDRVNNKTPPRFSAIHSPKSKPLLLSFYNQLYDMSILTLHEFLFTQKIFKL